ncbi:DsrE family protein [candidate division WOR-3 bacterium]|nr:DsrE family protein [candidate division WOR-3 bacterium]
MKKVAVFAFSGDPATFAHAMLNAMDMKDRGYDVKLVVEGDATKLLSLLRNETKPFADVYRRCLASGLIDRVCRACATRNGVVPVVIEQNLKFGDEMAGHPAMATYVDQGYEVVTL